MSLYQQFDSFADTLTEDFREFGLPLARIPNRLQKTRRRSLGLRGP